MTDPEKLISAARADEIPEGRSGLWYILKGHVKRPTVSEHRGWTKPLPPGIYTHLFRVTEGTIYNDPPGIVVMEDTPLELRTHLNFMMRARGRVLVTGLGLGCVVRGLLVNPAVEHVTCIERSEHVLKLVEPYMPAGPLEIIYADALKWTAAHNNGRFDCAWHDLWTDEEAGEDKLQMEHARLLLNCRNFVEWQGAWDFPRVIRRYMKGKGVKLI